MVGGCLKITYTGAAASCLLIGDSAAKTLTSKIGDAGAEAEDTDFGTAGILDLTGSTVDTLAELAEVIDAYDDYEASIQYGDDIPTEDILDLTVQAAGIYAYVLFDLGSVLSAYSLTSWARAKYILGLADSEQTKCEYLLNAITSRAEHIANRLLVARSLTKDLDGSGRPRLVLPVFPINSVSRVNIDSAGTFDSSYDLDTDEYRIYSDEGYIGLVNRSFPTGVQNVRIVWDGGFSPVPDDLQMAAIECLKWNLLRLAGESIGIRTVISSDGVNTGMEISIPLSAQRVFESYRVGM